MGKSHAGTWDPEAGAWQPSYIPMFEDRRTRKGFVEKVMGLVLLQLLVTVGACALFRYWEPLLVSYNLQFSHAVGRLLRS